MTVRDPPFSHLMANFNSQASSYQQSIAFWIGDKGREKKRCQGDGVCRRKSQTEWIAAWPKNHYLRITCKTWNDITICFDLLSTSSPTLLSAFPIFPFSHGRWGTPPMCWRQPGVRDFEISELWNMFRVWARRSHNSRLCNILWSFPFSFAL